MKLDQLIEAIKKPKDTILFQNEIGFIKGHFKDNGYYWLEKFYVNPDYRGKGLAKELAQHIPQKCELLAQPLFVKGETMLDKNTLINFYKSLGFREYPDQNDNMIMIRD